MNLIGGLIPIHLARSHREALTGTAVTVLNGDRLPAEDDRDSVEWIPVPGRGLTRRQTLPANERGPAEV